MSTPVSLPSKDSANLDLVRSCAVLCVFFAHFRDLITGTGAHVSWLFGQMGVLIFFVHTSLVLMLSLERSSTRLTGGRLALDFYVRRLFRIYPLSIVCVTLAFLAIVPTGTHPWPWSTYLSNLALTMNLTYSPQMWPVLWTLPLEVQMYVVLPVLFLWLRRRALGWAVAAWALAVVAGIVQPHVSGRLSVAEYAPCFLAGVIAWRLLHTVRPRIAGGWWPVGFAATTVIFLVAPRYNEEYYRWAFCLTLGCAIPWFADLRWAPLVSVSRTVAKYSYGIYLSHFSILTLAFTFEGVERWLLLVGLAVSVPVAVFHGIEQPMIDLGRWIATRSTPATRSAAAWPVVAAAQRKVPVAGHQPFPDALGPSPPLPETLASGRR
jgi:peptidoglycan/LPS O-acetylase OafA/YrhL